MSERDEPPKGAGELAILGHRGPLLPPGEYLARLVEWRTYYYHRAPKLKLSFQIVQEGEHFGAIIAGHYGAAKIPGKPKKWGTASLRPNSRLTRQLQRIYGPTARRDRLSLRGLMRCYLRVEVATVTKDSEQDERHECDRYSKVSKMLEIVEPGAMEGGRA